MIVTGALRNGVFVGRAGQPRDEVPLEVHEEELAVGPAEPMTGFGRGAADHRAARRPPTRSLAALTGRARARREWVVSARRAVYALAALLTARGGRARVGVPALGLLVRPRRRQLLDHHADLLQADRDVVEPGRLAAAVGVGAVALLGGGAVRHAATATARSCPRRPPCSAALATFFCALLVFKVSPFTHDREPARRGRRAQPAAAPPEHDVPPADALLGLRRVLDPVRVRDRRARSRAGSTPTGSARPAASR